MKGLGEIVCERFGQLKENRMNWEEHWDDVAKYIIPRKDNVYGDLVPGEKTNRHLFDSTAIKENDRLANHLSSLLTNPTVKWFGLTTGDTQLDANEEVAKWLSESTNAMIQVMNGSNFQTAIHETYSELPSFGTSNLRIDEDEIDVVRYHPDPVYELYLSQDNTGRIRTTYRKYEMTIRQIAEEFQDFEMDAEMLKLLKERPDKRMCIIHAIEKRKNFEEFEEIKTRLDYVSIHVLENKKLVLRSKGYNTYPYAHPRWSRTQRETYGRGPGMKALPDIKSLNMMQRVLLMGGQLAIAPPMQATENGLVRKVKFKPYGLTIRKKGSDPIQPLVGAGGARVDIGVDLIEYKKQDVREAFYFNELQIVQNDRMTATEIIQRRDEQFRSLGAILSRLHDELLKPVIDRTFDIMFRKNMFPEAPALLKESLRGGNLSIKYNSMISRAQETGDAENLTRAFQMIAPIIESKPQVLDNIDEDQTLKIMFNKLGVNPEFLRSSQKVKQMRQARMQAQREQADLEQAQQASEIGKNVQAGEG